jgi:hypothetical protein
MKFTIYADGVLVGWSELPMGDAPMGVCFGPFHPESGYSTIRPLVLERQNYDGSLGPDDEGQMKVWFSKFAKIIFTVLAEDGGSLHPMGIHFVDFADALPAEPSPYEVYLEGLPRKEYDTYFESHNEKYRKLFPPQG